MFEIHTGFTHHSGAHYTSRTRHCVRIMYPLSSVVCLAPSFSSISSRKRYGFRGREECVWSFSTTILTSITNYKNYARYEQNIHRSSCKVHVIFVRFLTKLDFSRHCTCIYLRVLVFVFCIVVLCFLYCFVYVYLFLFVLSVLV